jgi:predicted transcriptional regulator of viral defense system
MKSFFAQNPVFTLEKLERFLEKEKSGNPNTRKAILGYYKKKGRIIRLKRGLFAVVPPGYSPDSYTVDPFLLSAKMAEDAILSYHTALQFYGKSYSVQSRFYYLSLHKSIPMNFQGYEFIRVSPPASLSRKRKMMFGVNLYNRAGVEIKVTGFERTLVDVLDRPDLSGSWEEIWRSLESVEFFDIEKVIEYTQILENATTAAKVGFFLDLHKETLMVGADHLESLKKLRPLQPHYMIRGRRKDCRLVKEWNLMAPEEILNRSWEEVL